MQKITPHLWFDDNCEEAMNFYTSLFPDSKITGIQRYPENAEDKHLQGMDGKVLHGAFELAGLKFMALDAGPAFTFNPSISFFVNCESKEEVDGLWEKLIDGGKALIPVDKHPFAERYGWVQDKYGVTWQLIFANKPEGDPRPKMMPSLMFTQDKTGQAEAAIQFYTSVFKDAKISDNINHYPPEMPDREGMLSYGDFQLEGQWFAAMDTGVDQDFSFNEAISLYVECEDQEEVDYYWEKLSAVPEAEQCGWVKDQYGVSWQIVPQRLGELMSDPDKEKATRVMDALMKMKKIDVSELEEAYNG